MRISKLIKVYISNTASVPKASYTSVRRKIVRILQSHLLVHQNIDQRPVLSDAQTFPCSWPDCPGGNPAAAFSCHSSRGGPEGTEGVLRAQREDQLL